MNEQMAKETEIQSSANEPEEERRDLVAAAVGGDEDAADELLGLLAPRLMRILDHQMGAQLKRYLSVADIAQESLASLLGSLNYLRPQAGLSDARHLLFQHARWIVLRHGTDAGRFDGESVCQKISRHDRARSTNRSLGEVTLEDELSWLNELIEEMDPELGLVMRKRLEGKSFTDLAQEMQMSESAARKRFERGLDELQRLGEARKNQEH